MLLRHLSSYPYRMLTLAILISALMVWTFVSVAQAAAPPLGVEQWEEWYSDPALTQLVRYRHWDCDGTYSSWSSGTSGSYFRLTQRDC